MVATVNPNDNKTTLVSIPRDTYVDIVGYGTQDKINHAYAFGGAAMSMDTVEKYLDIPIDHYVSINMMGIKELVDAVGGVDVNNDLEFTQDGHQYAFGPIHLNGEEALGYIRMRYEDPRGDYGRQLRQRAIVEAVVKKVLTLDGVTQYRNILDAVEGNMKTDLSFSNMQKIALDYRGAFTTIDQLQMQGDGFMQDGISYQRVSENELNSVQNQLKKQLDTK
jgi:LCP family protein required for cell wall assembly